MTITEKKLGKRQKQRGGSKQKNKEAIEKKDIDKNCSMITSLSEIISNSILFGFSQNENTFAVQLKKHKLY